MKTICFLFAVLLTLPYLPLRAQQDSTNLGDALVSKLNIYVFPAQGQTKEQQEKDVSECYQWAVEQSGVNPLDPPKVEAEQVEGGPDGSAVRGAARGAAAGAAIGAIAGDAGKGAAIGAAAGGMGGRRASKAGQSQQQQQANQAAANQEQELMNNFKKAFSVCLEGKGYTVK